MHHVVPSLSDPRGKDHVSNTSNDLARWRIAEPAIVDESLRQIRGSCPALRGLGWIPVRDVHMKLTVLACFEKRDLAVVLHGTVCIEVSDGRFQ
jgi:hypothetical protein